MTVFCLQLDDEHREATTSPDCMRDLAGQTPATGGQSNHLTSRKHLKRLFAACQRRSGAVKSCTSPQISPTVSFVRSGF